MNNGKRTVKTKFINLYGSPGSHKSTTAAGLFYELKKQGKSVELITEVAKDWAWEGRQIGKYNQIELSAGQMTKEARLIGKVEYVITDSPSLLSGFYSEYYHQWDLLTQALLRFNDEKQNLNFYLPLPETYIDKGRFETKTEAEKIHSELYKFLTEKGVDLIQLSSNAVEEVLKRL